VRPLSCVLSQALQEREEAVSNGKLATIIFIRDRNARGQEVSWLSQIDMVSAALQLPLWGPRIACHHTPVCPAECCCCVV
jgi:hypothetical protein